MTTMHPTPSWEAWNMAQTIVSANCITIILAAIDKRGDGHGYSLEHLETGS